MYTIYADGKPLYTPHLFHEGCGVFSPVLTVELNKAGSLDFTLSPNNTLYDSLNKLKSMLTVYQNEEELFRGRVLHDEKDFYKQKKVYCEGDLSFLLDSIQRPYSYSGTVGDLFRSLIRKHNACVPQEKQFQVGKVTVSGKVSCNSSSYPNTLDEITERIINSFGGYMKTRVTNGVRYIDLLASSAEDGNTSTQIIEFGVNLLDITEHITAEDIFTVIIPVGATLEDEEGNTTDKKLTLDYDDYKPVDYIEDSNAINLFGRIERMVEWSDITNLRELYDAGVEYLANNIKMSISLTVKAVDMHLLNVDVDQIRVGDWVRVISIPHGIDTYYQCTKIVYDLVSPENNEYSFGLTTKSLTEQQVSGKKTMQSSVSTVLSTAGAVNASVGKANQAYQNMDTIISQMPTDYINQATFSEYQNFVNEKISAIESDCDDLLARVIELEGGTA